MNIAGRVAVVTGGASGMGLAIVKHLIAMGANCVIFDVDADNGAQVVSELGAASFFTHVDVSNEASVQAGVASALERFGKIHFCINCAGIAPGSKTLGKEGPFPLALWNKTIDINLTGTFNVLRLCAEQIAKNAPLTEDGCRGVILNIASIAAFEGQIGQAAYSASKGGIVALTLPVARDLASVGIRVNTIAPGLVDTPLFANMPTPVYDTLCRSPLFPNRLADPDDIAKLAIAVIENDYLNGECIRIDGGLRMQPK